MEEEEKKKKPKKKRKKKFKLGKFLIFLVIIGVIGFFVVRGLTQTAAAAYIHDPVVKRDIKTYHSFSGTVVPVTEKNVYAAMSGVKIKSLNFEEGDEIKEGDLLMTLDTKSINDQIEQLETSMSVTKDNTDLSIQQAYTNYINYKNDLEQGYNAQILAAKQQLDQAETNFDIAQRNYAREVSENQAGYTSTIRNAQVNTDAAYQQVRQAQIQLETADHAKRNASTDEARFQADQAYEQAEHSLESAWLNYNSAKESIESAKRGENVTLTNYLDQMNAARTTFLNAIDNYNLTVHAATQNLSTYQMQYAQALNSSNTSVNDLQLEKLNESLEDCYLHANLSGVITTLNFKEGDIVSQTMPVAVITNFDRMKVDIRINEYDLEGVSVGDKVEVTLNALKKDYVGTITEIDRTATVNGGVSYFNSVVEFAVDEDVRSGMSVEVRLVTNDKKDVLTVVPRAISTREDGTAYVMVMSEDGKTQVQRDVECGITDGTYVEITGGLEEGEEVLYLPETLQEMQMRLMTE
ncbi:MAG: efflux RND transporter periplasmic adaptor subunit [Lachnospiraceae bacterium]|nr:efflux RND transporter periplasmic adaptor subunit [Lachnospiraceae bacterium]